MNEDNKRSDAHTDAPSAEADKKKRINSVKDIRRRKQRKRRITALVLILGIAIIAGMGVIIRQRLVREAEAAAAGQTASHTVSTMTFREEVDISGNVEALKSENLVFRSAGEVKRVSVKVGDRVIAGQVLAELRTEGKEYELAELDYQIEQARFNGTPRQLELLEKRRELLVDDLSRMKLAASMGGVVSQVNIDPGDLVSSSVSAPAVRVIDISSLKAQVEVDEFDINLVRVGQQVELIFDALGSGIRIPGMVSSVPLEGRVTGQGIAVKQVEITIPDPPPTIAPSYTFSGIIIAGERKEILTVPQDFIVRQEDGSQAVHKRLPSGETVPVTLQTAYHEAGMLRILSGDLKEGDVIERQARITRSFPFDFGPPAR